MSTQTNQEREAAGVAMSTDYDPNSIMTDLAGMLGGDSAAPEEEAPVDEEPSQEGEESEIPSEESEETEEVEESEEAEAGSVAPKVAAKGNTEEIEVTDERGRRKITIDYSNKEAVKRAYQQAAGARKLYTKYQELRGKQEESSKQVTAMQEKAQLFDKMEGLYGKGGYRAVIEQLTGKPFSSLVGEYQAEQERLARMSPEDRFKHERAQMEVENRRVIEQLQKEKEEVLTSVRAEKEAASVERVQGIFDSLFEQHKFTGQVADKTQGYKLDKLLFNHVRSELADLEESGVQLSRPVIAKVMKDAAEALSFTIEQKAGAKATKHIANAKKQATRAAQSAIIQGERQVRSGNDTAINWEDDASIANFLHASMRKK